jgi:hypothetical protein
VVAPTEDERQDTVTGDVITWMRVPMALALEAERDDEPDRASSLSDGCWRRCFRPVRWEGFFQVSGKGDLLLGRDEPGFALPRPWFDLYETTRLELEKSGVFEPPVPRGEGYFSCGDEFVCRIWLFVFRGRTVVVEVVVEIMVSDERAGETCVVD